MKIGVIVPGSMLFPTAGLQFSEGLQVAMNKFGNKHDELVIESAGTCTDNNEIQKVANKLLLKDRVDTIVAYAGHGVFQTLAEICNEYKKILILADMGGVIGYKSYASQYVFMHSLNEWAAMYTLGCSLAPHNKYIVAAMSLMEAGYSLGYSFTRGLESKGNDIKGFFMSKLEINQDYFQQLSKVLAEENPDLMYCGFTGKDADVLFEGVGDAIEKSNTTLAGSGWMTLPATLEQYGSCIAGAKTASAYYTTLDNEANKKFLRDFEDHTENEGDRFAMLGYEIGMMLSKAAVYNDSGKLMSKKTVAELEQLQIDSPRGKVKYHPEEHYVISGCWYAEVTQDDKNRKYYNRITNHIEEVDMSVWRADESNWPNGGWYNPYPCT